MHLKADAFNGRYKNGTNVTQDWRCFAGFMRVVVLVVYQTKTQQQYGTVLNILSIFALLILALACPYKNRLFIITDSFGPLLFVCRFCVSEYRDVFSTVITGYFLLHFIVLKIANRHPKHAKWQV